LDDALVDADADDVVVVVVVVFEDIFLQPMF
jgi:hypothetical protein